MKSLKTVLKLLFLGGLAVVLMFLIKSTAPSNKPVARLFESKMSTPTPLKPTSTPKIIPTPLHTAIPTPTIPSAMVTKAAVVSKSANYTPEPPERYPVKSAQDIINVVLNDERFKQSINDPIFGPHVKGAIPGEPIQVRWLGEAYEGEFYYLIPFWQNDRVTGIAQVWVNKGMAHMGMWSNADAEKFPLVSRKEAKSLAKEQGLKITGEPELVFFETLETGIALTHPFWRMQTDQGVVFVIQSLGEIKVFYDDELHTTGEGGK
ncbi:MAG TPA: hypothetical protein G4N94_01230 [Caldilineae bacterium]|nr:hypothetical protein [Caldilineae bacterium]